MDYIPPRERDFAVDLESGVNTSTEAGSTDPVSGAKQIQAETFFTKFCQGFVSVDGLVKGENGLNLSGNALNSCEFSPENVKLLLIDKKVEKEEAADLVEKKMGKEKRKKTSAKKPPKPPRPPRGLSLDAADQKLIKEIAGLAMIKRERIERMKALKKMKAAKASSSNGNLFAMLFTILFFAVILFQGMSSRSSAVSFQGSLESAGATEGGFISVQDHWNPFAGDHSLPGSRSPNLGKQVSGSDPEGKGSRAA